MRVSVLTSVIQKRFMWGGEIRSNFEVDGNDTFPPHFCGDSRLGDQQNFRLRKDQKRVLK